MSVEMIGFAAVILMFVLMMLRVPIAISMFLPAVLGILYIRNWSVMSSVVESIIWNHSLNYTFSVIPMFIWMGEILTLTGISNELYSTFRIWLGRLRGGLGIATIGASAIFAAASGSSIANTATIGAMASNEMMKSKYNLSIAGGSVVAGGTLGLLIPPSTFMIVYGMMTEQSIGRLFIAGIIPGIVLSLLFMLTIYVVGVLKPEWAPAGDRFSLKERLISIKSTIWIIVLFIGVIGGMYVGFFGPTEAAGIGAFIALIMAGIRKKLNLTFLVASVVSTIKKCGFIYAIMLSSFLLNYLLTITKLPIIVSSFFLEASISPLLMFILIVLMYFVLGMFMDAMAVLLLTIPFVLPILANMNFDLIWFGVVLCILVEMALISPPYGMNLMVLNGIVPEMKIGTLYKGAYLFLIPMFIMIILLYLFPEIVLFLPDSMLNF